MQNGYIESCNGKFRDDHLNERWIESLHQARLAVATWRQDREIRPHRSLGPMPPARFVELHRHRAGDAAQSRPAHIHIEQSSGYSPMDGTQPSKKHRYYMPLNGIDPLLSSNRFDSRCPLCFVQVM